MNKTAILLIALALSLPALTDWVVDNWPPQPEGYSQKDRAGMDGLVERSLAKPHKAELSDRGVLFRPRNETNLGEVRVYLYGEDRKLK